MNKEDVEKEGYPALKGIVGLRSPCIPASSFNPDPGGILRDSERPRSEGEKQPGCPRFPESTPANRERKGGSLLGIHGFY